MGAWVAALGHLFYHQNSLAATSSSQFCMDNLGFLVAGPVVIGGSCAFLYSAGPFPLKYNAGGDFIQMVCHGPLIALYITAAVCT
jgi:1,4-dihydroxy-2-naphthoate octaprenyltransferase